MPKRDIFCRACLCALIKSADEMSSKCYNIFNSDNFDEKLRQCTNLKSVPWDDYPQSVCEKCYTKVLDFYEFQQMCHESLDKFKIIMENQTDNDLEELMAYDPLMGQTNANSIEEDVEEMVQNPLEASDEAITEGRVCNKVKMKKVRCSKSSTSADNRDNGDVFKETTGERLGRRNRNHGKLVMEQLEKNTKKNDDTVLDDLSDEEPSLSEESESSKNTTKSTFRCDTCPKTFLVQHRLEAHQRKHKGLPPYSCTYESCERPFNRWHYFQEHLKQHNASHQTYKCDINSCERVYKNKSALNVHIRKYHHCGPELKSHMCEQCGKIFKSSAVLNDHRFTHVDKSQLPYVCEVEGCAKKFSNKEKLKVHTLRHAGIKNFICPHCGMRKTTRNELKIHINYHTLERTWPCRFCAKVCNSAGNLKMHVRNIHERAKDFACRFCDRTFAKADTRKYHEMTHTGERPNACEECGRRFLQPAALRTHRKVHLKEKMKNTLGKQDTEMDKRKKSAEELEILECTTILKADVTESNVLGDNNEKVDNFVLEKS